MANGERYNLLNSAVLEMFDFIRREGIKSLIDYFVDKLYNQVEDVDYDATFLKLKDKFEQSQGFGSSDAAAAASSQLSVDRLRRDERALDRGKPVSDSPTNKIPFLLHFNKPCLKAPTSYQSIH